MIKKIGLIGLGKIGQNMALHLLEKKYKVVVYNRSPEPIKQLANQGAIQSFSLKELAEKLPNQKIIILMVTAGKPVDEIVVNLISYLSRGDIVIDGGNSYYEDSIIRHSILKKKGIHFLDMGTSGGLEGARRGASLSIGGEKVAFDKIEVLFKDIATKKGYAYVGLPGAGHFVKMIHNGIEYALLEAYAEGFEVLSKSQFKLDHKEVARIWNNGSIIRSYITELIERALTKNPELRGVDGVIGGGETGTWANKAAKSLHVDFKTLEHALEKRELSKNEQSFATRLIALVRNELGGHSLEKSKK